MPSPRARSASNLGRSLGVLRCVSASSAEKTCPATASRFGSVTRASSLDTIDGVEGGRMRVTLVQTEVDGSLPVAERVAGVAAQVAGRRGDDLVLLPELWATGYFAFDDYAATAEPLDGPIVTALSAAARAAGVTLHGGSIVERDDKADPVALHNTSLLFDPSGALVHTYRKVHLFGYGSREQELLTPGDQVGAYGPLALSTCY